MQRTFIIAEAGVNHNGNIEIAKRLVDEAAKANVDAIKFQTFRAENLVCKNAEKAQYQLETTQRDESQYEMLKKLELTLDMHRELISYCNEKQILFLSTSFDIESLKLLEQFQLPIIKIPSGEITNLPYLREAAIMDKDIILSSGMSHMHEIKEALAVLQEGSNKKISVLHCNTQYPTPMEDVNLNVLKKMKEELGVCIGYSDHTEGIEVPIAAVAMGAEIIEKHFTLDKKMEGPDHKASLEPAELIAMVKSIRNIEKALGSNIKQPTDSERDNIAIVRKSIVAKLQIKKGEAFSEYNMTTKRPGTGISPMKWDNMIGRKAEKDYEMDEMIKI